jgi:endonuclease/exonuclease/phosphatase family metal-dependent hydrolase
MQILFLSAYELARSDSGSTVTNQPLLSALPSRLTDSGPLDLVDQADSGGYSRSVVQWDGVEIAVYGLHLRSFSPDRPWLNGGMLSVGAWLRALDAFKNDILLRSAEVERIVGLLASEPLPFLVMGDMNGTPDQWTYRRLSDGLQDALLVSGGWSPTFPDERPLVQIDAVFASSRWIVHSAEVAPRGLSDHRAVLATLSLPHAQSIAPPP